MSNQFWANPDDPSSPAASELISPPTRPSGRGRLILWILTLGSFLGGAYYGYLFQKSPPAGSVELSLVDDGTALVAHWNARAGAVAAADKAQLTVSAGGRETVIDLDKAALQRGEATLDVDTDEFIEAHLKGAGLESHARYVPGDPLEPEGSSVDADALRQQLADQQQINAQLERRLSAAPH